MSPTPPSASPQRRTGPESNIDGPATIGDTEAEPLRDLAATDAAVAWAMVEAAPDALVLVDEHGIVELVNRQSEVLFGYDRGELLGRPVEALLPGRYATAHTVHRTGYRAAPGARPMGEDAELVATHRDGTEIPVEISLSPIHIGDALHVIAAVRDVRHRKATEAATERIRRGIDAITDGVYMLDPESLQFIYANEGAARQTGYRTDELVDGMTPLHISQDFTPAAFERFVAPVLDDRVPSIQGEAMILHRSGRAFPVEFLLEYPPVAHGQTRVLVAVARDVSERVAAQAQLRASESRFRDAFDDGPVPMAVLSIEGNTILEVNDAFEELVGFNRNRLIGMSTADLTHPDGPSPGPPVTSDTPSDTPAESAPTLRLAHADGHTVWVQIHVASMEAQDGEQVLIVHALDVTAEIEARVARARHRSLSQAVSVIRLAMLQGASRHDGLTLLCRAITDTLEASAALVVTPTGTEDELGIAAAADLPDEVLDWLRLETGEGIVGEAFRTGKPLTGQLADPRVSRAYRPLADHYGTGSLVAEPLHGASGVAGVLVVVRDDEAAVLDDAEVAAVETFASEAVVAIELADLRESERRLELLEDRERIGRDMHDNVIGRLFAAGMGMQAVMNRVDDPAIQDRLSSMVDDIDDSIKEIRSTVYGIRSQIDWAKGVRGEILSAAAEQRPVLGFEPQVCLDGPLDELAPTLVDEMLATMREALANIVKYANATAVTITASVTDQTAELIVEDNGVGMELSPTTDSPTTGRAEPSRDRLSHHGLANMKARAESLGGTATITSDPQYGTTVLWSVPLG